MRGLMKDIRMAVRFFQNDRRIRKDREGARARVCQFSAYKKRKGVGV